MWTAEVAFAPVRRWSVFLVNHSHTDIGFTHTYRDCIRVHVKNLRLALEAIEATADWPDESRMRWTVESAWQLQHYLRTYPEDRDRISRAVRGGWLEIEALYIHSYFDILSREQLVRSLTFTERMRHDLDIPITSAMICDVPGCAWSLVDLFAQSGITYLAMAPNNFIAPFHAQTDAATPVPLAGSGRKPGPDLVYRRSLVGLHRGRPTRVLDLVRDGPGAAAPTPGRTRSLRLPVRCGPVPAWQRQPATPDAAGHDRPRVERALPLAPDRDRDDLAVLPAHGSRATREHFPVESGEWQSSWSETTLHYPHEAALSRRNHHTLAEWQGFSALAGGSTRRTCRRSTRSTTPSMPRCCSTSTAAPRGSGYPRSEQEALDAIVQGFELFEQETIPAEAGREAALAAATGALRTGDDPVVVVWNLCSWPRSGPVAIDVPGGYRCPVSRLTSRPATVVPIAGDRDDG